MPWILKPLFGFMADWLYPFYYRTKGYMVMIGLMNVAFSLLAIFTLKEDFKETDSALLCFIFMILIYTCLAGVDSICRNKA